MSNGIYSKLTGYHNRRSMRLPAYDYSRPGYYFVTVCIHDRKRNFFGDINNFTMVLNKFGAMAQRCWHEIPQHFPYVQLDTCIVMPNHIHGVIRICDHPVSVGSNDYSPQQMKFNRPCGTSKTIGSIIRSFKIGVTKLVRQQIPDAVVWQRNYYEHIIRDEKSLFFIRNYIRDNPLKWDSDGENHINREIIGFERLKTAPPKCCTTITPNKSITSNVNYKILNH